MRVRRPCTFFCFFYVRRLNAVTFVITAVVIVCTRPIFWPYVVRKENGTGPITLVRRCFFFVFKFYYRRRVFFFILLFSGDTGFRARVIVSSRPNFSFYVRVRTSPPPDGTYVCSSFVVIATNEKRPKEKQNVVVPRAGVGVGGGETGHLSLKFTLRNIL